MAQASFKVVRGTKPKLAAAPGPIKAGSFILFDDINGTFSVFGLDRQGHERDISADATLEITSDNEDVLKLGAVTGMSAPYTPGNAGHANVHAVVTLNDGSAGPFEDTADVEVQHGKIVAIVIKPTP